MSMVPQFMVWVDLETTGLDPENDAILEIGLIVTDVDLTERARWSKVIRPGNWSELKSRMDAFVVEMHAGSGLYREVDEIPERPFAFTNPVRDAEKEAHGWLKDVTSGSDVGPMCGSSVHFDRAFLKVHMPMLEQLFSHRNIDVSSVMELDRRWVKSPDALLPTPSRSRHRALDDLEDSIALARFYREGLWCASKSVFA